jgi:hypothetical protein
MESYFTHGAKIMNAAIMREGFDWSRSRSRSGSWSGSWSRSGSRSGSWSRSWSRSGSGSWSRSGSWSGLLYSLKKN